MKIAPKHIGWVDIEHTALQLFPEAIDRVDVAHACGYAAFIYTFALSTGAERLVEIGVDVATSTVPLLWAARQMGGHVWSIDIDPRCGEGAHIEKIKRLGLERYWTFIAGDSTQRSTPVHDIDFLYVDGDHSFDAVRADMRIYGNAVRTGGIILMDDYHVSFPGVVRYVDRFATLLDPIRIGPWILVKKRENQVFP